jgi:hypothetical protein
MTPEERGKIDSLQIEYCRKTRDAQDAMKQKDNPGLNACIKRMDEIEFMLRSLGVMV